VTRFLLDTSVLSALAPGRPLPSEEHLAWGRENQHRLHVPTIALLEIHQGICKLRRAGADKRVVALSEWFRGILADFSEHVVDLDRESAICAGELADKLQAQGQHPGLADIMIAGVAKMRGFAILSRNIRHFEPTGVPVFDPFSADPAKLPT
jgi:predicted nucleic acid-binding protein